VGKCLSSRNLHAEPSGRCNFGISEIRGLEQSLYNLAANDTARMSVDFDTSAEAVTTMRYRFAYRNGVKIGGVWPFWGLQIR